MIDVQVTSIFTTKKVIELASDHAADGPLRVLGFVTPTVVERHRFVRLLSAAPRPDASGVRLNGLVRQLRLTPKRRY